MLAELDNYDWAEAFKYAGESGEYRSASPDIRKTLGVEVALTPFTRDDVVELIGIREGENDGASWKCAGRLSDGRWFFLEAGCDYTGWG